MSKRTKIGIIKWFSYILVITVLYSVQTTPNFIAIKGVTPNLIIAFSFFIAILSDQYNAIFIGALTGLFLDFSGTNIIGFSSIILMILFYFSSYIQEYYLKYKFTNSIFMFSANLFVYQLIVHIIYYFIWYQVGFNTFLLDAIFCYIYTLICSILLYRLSNTLYYFFKKQESLDV